MTHTHAHTHTHTYTYTYTHTCTHIHTHSSCNALAMGFEDGIVPLEGVPEHADVLFITGTYHMILV